MCINGNNIVEAMINGRIVWPEEEFHWQPNADMIWARSQWEALSGGRSGYLRMHYSSDLISDFFYQLGTVITSDGATYEVTMSNGPIKHTWDYSNSRQSEVYTEKKVVWTAWFPNSIDAYPHELDSNEVYYCFDGVNISWSDLIDSGIAYFDLLNNANPYYDESWDGYAYGFFNGLKRLQAIPNEFRPKLDVYRLSGIFAGCSSLVYVPYLDMENAEVSSLLNTIPSGIRVLNLVNVNISIDLSVCPNLTKSSLISTLNGLADRTGLEQHQICLGQSNTARLSQSDLNIAINKNWIIVDKLIV
jgi:hypothetical protein